jgi:hypothetical protein
MGYTYPAYPYNILNESQYISTIKSLENIFRGKKMKICSNLTKIVLNHLWILGLTSSILGVIVSTLHMAVCDDSRWWCLLHLMKKCGIYFIDALKVKYPGVESNGKIPRMWPPNHWFLTTPFENFLATPLKWAAFWKSGKVETWQKYQVPYSDEPLRSLFPRDVSFIRNMGITILSISFSLLSH